MKQYIIIAAIAALGFTACEEKKDAEQKAKDDAAARKGSQQSIRNFIGMLAPKIHLDSVRYD